MQLAAAAVEPSDEELADALSTRDHLEAFDALVRRFHRRVWGICYRITASAQEAEDLSQETFLRLYQHRDTYQRGRTFRPWLDKICLNVCLRHRERARRLTLVTGLGDDVTQQDTDPARFASPDRDPEARAANRELVTSIQKLLEMLPVPYRAALALRAFAGLTYQEIADNLNCSIGTVMSRINRARIKVRNHLKELV